MKINNHIVLDFNKTKQVDTQTIQCDMNSRFVRVSLRHNNSPIDLSDVRVCIMAVKPDGKEIFNDCTVIDAQNGIAEFEITKQMGIVVGEVECQIKLFGKEKLLSSNIFNLSVSKSLSPNSRDSKDQLNTLVNTLGDVQDIDNRFNKINYKIDENYQKVNAQLSQLDNKKLDKSGIVTMANMGQDVKEAMTGGAVAVVGENSVLTCNIVNGQVTPDKTDFIEEYGNLFVKETCIDGKKINSNGTITDVDGFWISDKIRYTGEELFTQGVLYYMRYDYTGKILGTQKPSTEYPCDTFIVGGNGVKDGVIVSFGSLLKDEKYNIIPKLRYNVDSERDIVDNSITTDKVTFVEIGKNLFNKDDSTIRDGYTFNNNTGVESEDATKFIYEIKVEPSSSYVISGSSGTYQLNTENKTRITGANFFTDVQVVTTTKDTKYLKVALSISRKDSIQIEKGDSKTGYEEYCYKIPNLKVEVNGNGNNSSLDLELDLNLFNPHSDNILFDKQFASSGGMQNMPDWFISDYIEVDSSYSYKVKNINLTGSALWGYYQTYDGDKKIIDSRLRFDNDVAFSLNENVKYIRITANTTYCTDSGVHKLFVCKSDEAHGYVKYGKTFQSLNLMPDNIQANFYKWYGKKLCAFGDSNTGNKMWQSYIIDKFGMKYSHLGVGGTTAVGRCSDTELEKIPLDTDVITIMFGTNDISQGVPLGELPTFGINANYEFDTTTYIGALCKMIKYISVNIPTCRIILIAPLYRSNSKLNQTANEYSKFDKYIQACEDIAKRFGCEFINMYQELGANMWNYGAYFLDESSNGDGDCWAVHLSKLGGKRFAEKVISKLLDIEPID